MKTRTMAVVALAAGLAAPAFAGDAAKGKAVFEKAKCSMCHTDAKNPLAKAGAGNSEADLKAWVRTPKDMMAKKGKTGTMLAFGPQKISDAELDDLVTYLASMK